MGVVDPGFRPGPKDALGGQHEVDGVLCARDLVSPGPPVVGAADPPRLLGGAASAKEVDEPDPAHHTIQKRAIARARALLPARADIPLLHAPTSGEELGIKIAEQDHVSLGSEGGGCRLKCHVRRIPLRLGRPLLWEVCAADVQVAPALRAGDPDP